MKIKNTLIGATLLTVGYQVGKIVGYVRSTKFAFDVVESIEPGSKKTIVKTVSDKIIDSIFKPKEDENKKEES